MPKREEDIFEAQESRWKRRAASDADDRGAAAPPPCQLCAETEEAHLHGAYLVVQGVIIY